ncbi:MAG: hypothetical protein KGO96_07025 [Elusimicrobia bacterium]|nr:hypothetical protein [Elusimicrobiota bacterium]
MKSEKIDSLLKRCFTFALMKGSLAAKHLVEHDNHSDCSDGKTCLITEIKVIPKAYIQEFSIEAKEQIVSFGLYTDEPSRREILEIQMLEDFERGFLNRLAKTKKWREEKDKVGRRWHCKYID